MGRAVFVSLRVVVVAVPVTARSIGSRLHEGLHFGAVVPAPAGAALGLLALAGFAGRRRRLA